MSTAQALSLPGEIAYGPVTSRRLGTSLGINLLGPQKFCSFDCPYCDLGPSINRMNQIKDSLDIPTVAAVEEALRVKLRVHFQQQIKIDTITLSGNGEPTLHPEFLECVEAILKVRTEMTPQTPVVALTNGAHLDAKRVVQGLNLLDERMVKLDAGSDRLLKIINRPLVRANLSKLSTGIRKLKDVIVQSAFVQGTIENTKPEDIEEWLEILGILKPKSVHIYTLNRPSTESGVHKVDEDTLYTIQSRLKRKLQIDSQVFC
jgi:wyosine [tRNA(Phe)-imidazoG37] synthetase (radical SAM superfamily)